jgi:hypothetical protein
MQAGFCCLTLKAPFTPCLLSSSWRSISVCTGQSLIGMFGPLEYRIASMAGFYG